MILFAFLKQLVLFLIIRMKHPANTTVNVTIVCGKYLFFLLVLTVAKQKANKEYKGLAWERCLCAVPLSKILSFRVLCVSSSC